MKVSESLEHQTSQVPSTGLLKEQNNRSVPLTISHEWFPETEPGRLADDWMNFENFKLKKSLTA